MQILPNFYCDNYIDLAVTGWIPVSLEKQNEE